MNSIIAHVEAAADAAGAEVRAASAKALAEHIKGVVGVSCKVDVLEPGDVERSAGKAVRAVDKR